MWTMATVQMGKGQCCNSVGSHWDLQLKRGCQKKEGVGENHSQWLVTQNEKDSQMHITQYMHQSPYQMWDKYFFFDAFEMSLKCSIFNDKNFPSMSEFCRDLLRGRKHRNAKQTGLLCFHLCQVLYWEAKYKQVRFSKLAICASCSTFKINK